MKAKPRWAKFLINIEVFFDPDNPQMFSMSEFSRSACSDFDI